MRSASVKLGCFRWLATTALWLLVGLSAAPLATAWSKDSTIAQQSNSSAGSDIGSCDSSAPLVEGKSERSKRSISNTFVMISAYKLEPYSLDYVTSVLAEIARRGIQGIVYSSIGEISSQLVKKGGGDELALNRSIFAEARRLGAKMWLQMRLYGNQLEVTPGEKARNVTAQEIIEQPEIRRAFVSRLKDEFAIYNEFYSTSCKVVLFEEAGIYHSVQGGGYFWSSTRTKIDKHTDIWDEVFAARLATVFDIAARVIKSVNPACSIGAHLGHSVFRKPELLRAHFDMASIKPDFIFYDFYLKSQPNYDSYFSKLKERVASTQQILGLPIFHLGQLHTMNNFQHGLGRTPSKGDIDQIVELSASLGVQGFGFYNKNAVPTSRSSQDALDPNAVGQATVFQSSKDRWDYGMQHLMSLQGVDLSNLFDLVLFGSPTGNTSVDLWDFEAKKWVRLGSVNSLARRSVQSGASLLVIRALSASRFLQDRRGIVLRMTPDSVFDAWLLPTEPIGAYREAKSIDAELHAKHAISNAHRLKRMGSGATGGDFLCTSRE